MRCKWKTCKLESTLDNTMSCALMGENSVTSPLYSMSEQIEPIGIFERTIPRQRISIQRYEKNRL